MPQGATTVSVIIPVHSGRDAFRACLDSVRACNPAPDEIIVVADGKGDGAWRHASSPGIKLIKNAIALGPARARNRAAREARGDILFFIDADVTVPRDAVLRVLQAFAEDPQLAAVIGSYDDKPAHPGFLSQYRNLLHHFVHQSACADASTFWGACGAIRRDVFEHVRGFDESYRRPSIEDIELGYRLVKQRFRIRLDRDLLVKHHKRWTPFNLLWTDVVDRAIPWTRLILRERMMIDDLNLTVGSRVSVALAAVGFIAILGLPSAWAWLLGLMAAGGLLYTNRDLYQFLMLKRGGSFAALSVLWHWLYLGCSGLGFAIGLVTHHGERLLTSGRSTKSRPRLP